MAGRTLQVGCSTLMFATGAGGHACGAEGHVLLQPNWIVCRLTPSALRRAASNVMPTLSLSVSQQHLLHDFVVGEPELPADATRALARLLENVMESVNVRQLDCVSPEEVRELLRATFEVMKVRHLYENGFLSDGQFRSRLESAREQVASYH